jgi:hypothetical protein
MKKIFLAFISLSLLIIAQSCDKDLPYPLKEVKRGVLVDVYRIPGTDGVLAEGVTTGDYKIRVTIPEQQGDYSFMKCVQLLAVLKGADNKWTTRVIVDDITTFQLEIIPNIANIYSMFGLTAPSLGEELYLTSNVVLNDGSVIPGWTEITGFNNVAFGGWQVDGRAYSSNARYAVACAWDKDPVAGSFIGTFSCTEVTPYGNDSYDVTLSHNPNLPAVIPPGVTASNLYGVDITPFSPNIWEAPIQVITVWINTENLTLIIPNQSTGEYYSNGMLIQWCDATAMSVSTCSRTISFQVRPYMPGFGGWGYFTFTIRPK